jgi:RND family efflux transporter MFP subunit
MGLYVDMPIVRLTVSPRGLAALAIAVAIGAGLPAAAADKPVAKQATLTAIVAPVTERALRNDIVATGNVVAWREIPVSTEANGLAIVELLVDEGDRVENGQVLARLNSRVLIAQIAQQKAVIAELEAQLATAQSDLNRARGVSAGVMSAQAVEQRETLVRTTTAKIAAARAALEESSARFAQTEIVAPTAGLIASRNVALGQVVQTGTELFKLIQEGRIEVDAMVPEAELLKVKAGQNAKITGPTGEAEAGEVRIVAPIVDAKTRLGTVRIALGPDTQLKPGMFARVEIGTEVAQALAVPLKSLVWRQSKPGVFKVDAAGKAAFTEVSTGRKTSDYVEVRSGLRNGETIVVDGAGLLNDGDTVRVEMASAPGRSAQ